ncbi:MAG TPA: serine/threonine-protein kinase [Ktedonobacteraceae bacterium]|nr:serine/threonine-protein kinase [Ktedonobacteraceae bacterium]
MADFMGLRLGNYQLERVLGQGGFADVYLGKHIYLNTQVAIKVLQARLTSEDTEAFLNEARTIASLMHPNIVRVFDFGIEKDLPYLVMDYAPHGTLRRLFPRGVAQPAAKLVPYVKQLASALQYAHDRNLVHRDIKPENMLVGRDNDVLLSDFGIATIAKSSQSQHVETAGTVIYMAPEQLKGRPRPASDQYALGIVVYEWLSGSPPFQGTFTEVASQHLFAELPPLHQKVPSIPPALETVVRQALAKEFHERFVTVAEFASAFERACSLPPANPASPVPLSAHDAYMTVSTLSQATIPTVLNTPPESASQASASVAPLAPAALQASPAITPHNVTPGSPPLAPGIERQQGVSRRRALFGIVGGLVIVAAGALGGYEFIHTQGTPKSPGIPPNSTPGTPVPDPSPAPAQGTTLLTYRGHRGYVYSVTWSPDAKNIASASYDQSVQVWKAATGTLIFSYSHNGAANSVAWSPDGSFIASSGEDAVVRVVNAKTGGSVLVYQGHTASVYEVKFSPDSSRVSSVSADKTVRVWDAQTGNTDMIYTGHSDVVWAAVWSPDGSKIVSGGADKTVQIWNVSTGTPLLTYKGHSAAVRTVAWSPDGRYIASGGDDNTVQVWDAQTGKMLFTFQGHTDRVWAVNWSPSFIRLVSGSKDATAQVWDALSGNHLYVYRGHSDTVFDAAWSPADGTRIATGSSDSTVQIWEAV